MLGVLEENVGGITMEYKEGFLKNLRDYESGEDFVGFFLKELEKVFQNRAEKEEYPAEVMFSSKAKEAFIVHSEINLVFDGMDIVFYELGGKYHKSDMDKLVLKLIEMAQNRKWDIFYFQRGILEIMGYKNATDLSHDHSFINKVTMEGRDYN